MEVIFIPLLITVKFHRGSISVVRGYEADTFILPICLLIVYKFKFNTLASIIAYTMFSAGFSIQTSIFTRAQSCFGFEKSTEVLWVFKP